MASIIAIAANLLGYGTGFMDGLKGALFAGGGFIITLAIEFIVKRVVMGGEC